MKRAVQNEHTAGNMERWRPHGFLSQQGWQLGTYGQVSLARQLKRGQVRLKHEFIQTLRYFLPSF